MKYSKLLLFVFLVLVLVTSSCILLDDGNTTYYPDDIIANYSDSINNQNTQTQIQQLPTCSDSNGYSCKYSEYCSSSFLNVSDSNECCASPCTQYQKTNTCNYNTIAEINEDNSCKDLQCKGTLCGGFCYNTKGTCCGDKFVPFTQNVYCDSLNIPKRLSCDIPGRCFDLDNPLVVEFDLPNLYEVGVSKNGLIKITNNGDQSSEYNLEWGYNPNFKILISTGENLNESFTNISLLPSESINIPITITPQKENNLLERPTALFDKLVLVAKVPNRNIQYFVSDYMRIYSGKNNIVCDRKIYDMRGLCVNNIFYPDIDCEEKEIGTVKDYSILCANGFLFDEGNRLSYNSTLNTLTIREPTAHRDVNAIGNKKVLVTRINNNINLNVSAMKDWVEGFYDLQSDKIVGSNMVDFDFEDKGIIKVDWNKIDETSPNANLDLRDMMEKELNMNGSDYDIIVGFTDKTHSKIIFNESGGVYLPGSRVILMDIGSAESYYSLAHEIGHSFGAPDLYLNGTYPLACGFQLINDIMCGSSTLISSISSKPSPESFELYTAPFIGWGDIDGDGVLDVRDNLIMRVPSWSQGIEILEVYPTLATITYPNGVRGSQFSVTVYVIDKKTQKLVPAIVSISSPSHSDRAFTNSGFISFLFPQVPTSQIDITATVQYADLIETQTITFDPNTYTYTPSKYDPNVNGP